MPEKCDTEMQLSHQEQITRAWESTKSAHNRLDGLVLLITDFTKEMRESNANIGELVGQVKVLAVEIGHLASTTKKHEEDIDEIRDNMETKDTVLKLYARLEKSDEEYKKGMDAIMALIRAQDDRMQIHENEPARQALEDQKSLKRWMLAGFGSIILSIISTGILFLIYNK